MNHKPRLLVLTAYRIFRVLMLIALGGYFWYFGHYAPIKGVPWTALVIPFVPVWVPFIYRLIFREEEPRHLWLYVASLAIFLMIEGVLYWPYTVFGLFAIAASLTVSFLTAAPIVQFHYRRHGAHTVEVEVEREPAHNRIGGRVGEWE